MPVTAVGRPAGAELERFARWPLTVELCVDQGLSQCAITTLYIVNDRGSIDESDFLQVRIDVEDEWTDRPLFSDWPHSLRGLRDLIDSPGYELPVDKRARVRPPAYRLVETVDVKRFVQEAIEREQLELQALRGKRYTVRTDGEPEEHVLSFEEAFPGWDASPVKWRRIFADWALSSAGRSGARLCEHWAMQMTDYMSPAGQRSISLIPVWGTTLKLAEVEGRKGNVHELFGALQKLDTRVKVPSPSIFFMLHGNRVSLALLSILRRVSPIWPVPSVPARLLFAPKRRCGASIRSMTIDGELQSEDSCYCTLGVIGHGIGVCGWQLAG